MSGCEDSRKDKKEGLARLYPDCLSECIFKRVQETGR